MILTCYFVDKSVVRGPKMYLIIAPLEVYIARPPISASFSKKAERKVGRRPFQEAGSGQNNGTR